MNINIRGELYDLSSSKVMGILNFTPDSFYDGSQDLSVKAIQNKYKKIKDASIIDVGCESTRPGSFSIEASEEIRRLGLALPIIRKNKDNYSKYIVFNR